MFWNLLKKELISHILTLRFAVTFGLTLIMGFGAFIVSIEAYKSAKAQYQSVLDNQRDDFEQISQSTLQEQAKWKKALSESGLNYAVAPAPLSVLNQGIGFSMQKAFRMQDGGSSNLGLSTTENPVFRLFRTPDFVYVVTMIFSFLAILLVYDAISGEKENGTLRLVLSNSVPRYLILLSKWVAGLIMLLTPLAIVFAGGVWYSRLQGVLELTGGNLSLIFLLFVVACLYISVFFTLGLTVSTFTKRSGTSLFVCLAIWAVSTAIIPSLANSLATVISPVPSHLKIGAEMRVIWQETQLLTSKPSVTAKERKEIEADGQFRRQQLVRFMERSVKRQEIIAGILARLSPSACWNYAAAALTQTGPNAFVRIFEARDRLAGEIGVMAKQLEEQTDGGKKCPVFRSSSVPPLKVYLPKASESMMDALQDTLILAVLNVFLFLAAFVGFVRYDVR